VQKPDEVFVHVCMYVCMYVHISMHVRMHVYHGVHENDNVFVYACVCDSIQICMVGYSSLIELVGSGTGSPPNITGRVTGNQHI